MSTRLGAFAATVALIVLPAGVAVAGRISGGSPKPPRITTYAGTDSAGTVSFKLYTYPSKYVRGAAKLVINSFYFANACVPAGTTVRKGIPVSSHHTFSIDRATSAVTKIVSGSLHGKSDGVASGTARVVTAGCDSGSLKFAVKRS